MISNKRTHHQIVSHSPHSQRDWTGIWKNLWSCCQFPRNKNEGNMLKLHHEEAISETQMVQTAACQRTQVTQQVRCMEQQRDGQETCWLSDTWRFIKWARLAFSQPQLSLMASTKKGDKKKQGHWWSAINEVVARGYTINIPKCIYGMGLKKHDPRSLKETQEFATKEMGTPHVHVDTRFNKALWAKANKECPTLHAFNKQALYTGYCVICHHFLKSRDSYCGWELTANCQMKLQNHQRKSNKWARLNHEDREAHTGDKSTEQWNRVTAVKVKEGLLLERDAVVIWMGNVRASLVTEEVLFIDPEVIATMAFV